MTSADDKWRELTAGWQPAPPDDLLPSESLETQFQGLLRAARSLLNEYINKEELIYPTLALAAEIDVGVSRLVDVRGRLVAASRDDREWETEAKRFMSEYQNLVPTRVLNEVLIIERLPLSVRIHYHHATAIPHQVVITAYQHSLAKCAAITQAGAACKGIPIDASGYCYAHHPDYTDKRRRHGSRGGKRGGRGRPQAELHEIKILLADLTARVLKEEGAEPLETGPAAVANQLINTCLRAVEQERKIKETEELEERIEALEQTQDREKEARKWREV